MSDKEMKEKCYENLMSLETIYYLLFITFLITFMFGSKFCKEFETDESGLKLSAERKMMIDSGLDSLTYKE